MSEKVSTFKDRFVALCETSGKTNTELAKDLHVSNQTISAWKTGVRSPKEPAIIAIANYFGVKVEWLMGFDVNKEVRPAFEIMDLFAGARQQLNAAILPMLSERIAPQSPPTPEEDAKMSLLWRSASLQAKRAAIAVLESMKEVNVK